MKQENLTARPGIPVLQGREDVNVKEEEYSVITFPTTPGSLIRATATDCSTPTLFMLVDDVLASEEYDVTSAWTCSHEGSKYNQRDLRIVEVVHDEGRAQMLAVLPPWTDLTDRDKGLALIYATNVADRGHAHAVESCPARFLDHPILVELRSDEACAYVDSLGIDLTSNVAVLIGADESSLPWAEYQRLYGLADAD
jgi:hypothetical protein